MEKPKSQKHIRIKQEEKDFIRQNCLSMTDEMLAKQLNRDIRSIRSVRKQLGITKRAAGKLQNFDTNSGNINGVELKASQKLTEDQRKEFFKTQLTNTLYYQKLKDQFTDDEINFYLEEWGALCLQFEDIVATEKRQIDELIKITIMGIRVLRNVKIAEQEIEHLQEEIEDYRDNHKDIENDLDAQEYDNGRSSLLRIMMGQSQVMSNDYQKNIDIKNKILGELNARRRDRVDQLMKRGTTFLGLVSAFRDRQIREEHGRHMELVRLAKEKKKAEWRKPIKFEDGVMDCILMDEFSVLPKQDIVLLENMGSRFVEKYNLRNGAKILVVDNDQRRQQFFSHTFNGNDIEFASSVAQALVYLENVDSNYDLVCLDYDLGLGEKGIQVAKAIVEKNLCVNSDILVQSMNKNGAKEIVAELGDKFSLEVCPFEEIIKSFLNKEKEKEKDIKNA